MKTFWIRFWKETEGQDLVEYALIVAAIALASPAAVLDLPAAAKAPVLWRSPAIAEAQSLPSKAALVVRHRAFMFGAPLFRSFNDARL